MTNSVLLNGKYLPINVNPEKGQGCYFEILEAIDNQLTAMLSHHSRVLVVILGFHLRNYSKTNQLMSNFIRKIKKCLKRKYGLLRVGHIWGREKHTVDNQHYHVAFLLNGNDVKHSSKIIEHCEKIWIDLGQPKPHTPEHCFYLVNRDNPQEYNEVFYRLSYLAKKRGKGKKPKATNDYSASRIKKKLPNDFGKKQWAA